VSSRIACVIPAYRAAGTLDQVVRVLRVVLPQARIVIVDDGSPDETPSIAGAVADRAIRLPRNQGKGGALRAGFADVLREDDDVALTIDADGQHDSRYAPALLAALEDHDVVLGQRGRSGSTMPLGRRVTNAMSSLAIAHVTGIRLDDTQSGFRAIRRRVLEHIDARGDRYEFETDFLIRAARAGFRIGSVAIPTVYGATSHFRGMRDSARIVKAIWAHRRATAGARMR
jgi:glycosyltransferase involved in cell wall biosynthesis